MFVATLKVPSKEVSFFLVEVKRSKLMASHVVQLYAQNFNKKYDRNLLQ